MKISKNTKKKTLVTSSEIAPTTTVIGNPSDVMVSVDNVPVEQCPYTLAQDFIKSAIGALTAVAGEDPIAKESIANLAVVLMDLQSC